MKIISKLLLVCMLCFFFLGCGSSGEDKQEVFREHVEKRVHNRIKKRFCVYQDFVGTEILKFKLVHSTGDEYTGTLTVRVKEKMFDVDVFVTANQTKIRWEIPKSEQDKILEAKNSW